MVKYLIDANADVNVQNGKLIYFACENNDIDMVKRLLSSVSDFIVVHFNLLNNTVQKCVIHDEYEYEYEYEDDDDDNKKLKRRKERQEKLKQEYKIHYKFDKPTHGIDLQKYGFNALFKAVWHVAIEIVELLIDHGVIICNTDYELLTVACLSNNKEMVQFMLDQGIPSNGDPNGERSPLDIAYYYSYNDVIKTLLDYGATLSDDIYDKPKNDTMKEIFIQSKTKFVKPALKDSNLSTNQSSSIQTIYLQFT